MRIGLMAGTFDPPHLGHLAVAKTALWSGEIDTVWFLPCWEHAFGKKPVSFINRVCMCRLMTKDERDIQVCTDESEIKSTYSIDILNYLQYNNQDKSFRLVMGSDNYWKMDLWKNKTDVVKIAPPIWIDRPGESNIPEKSYPLYNTISSTEVRELLAKGESVNHLLHPKVIEFIVQNKVY